MAGDGSRHKITSCQRDLLGFHNTRYHLQPEALAVSELSFTHTGRFPVLCPDLISLEDECAGKENIPKLKLSKPFNSPADIWMQCVRHHTRSIFEEWQHRINDILEQPLSEVSDITRQQILVDLPRTFPEHSEFQEDKATFISLRQTLFGFAELDPSIGYCQ
eukprot:gene9584-10406_t